MPILETKASGSAQAYGFTGIATTEPFLVDQLFDVVTWVGTGSSQNISTNQVDLSAQGGGMVWIKNLDTATVVVMFNTLSGVGRYAGFNNAETIDAQSITAFGQNTFTVGTSSITNASGNQYQAFVFKVRAGFFEMQLYTGTGANATINHNLGYAPSQVYIKKMAAGTGAASTTYQQNAGTGFGTTAYGVVSVSGSTLANIASATYMTALPTSSSIFVGTNILSNENAVTYLSFMFGEAAIFSQNRDEQVFAVQNLVSGTSAWRYKFPKFSLSQLAMTQTSGGANTVSGFNYTQGISAMDTDQSFNLYSSLTSPSFTSNLLANNAAGIPSGGGNGIVQGAQVQGINSATTYGPSYIIQKYHMLPTSNTLCQYVSISGVSQTVTIPFYWDMYFVHVDNNAYGFGARAVPDFFGYTSLNNNTFWISTINGAAATTTNRSAGYISTAVSKRGNSNSISTISSGGALNRVLAFKHYKGYAQGLYYQADAFTTTVTHNFGVAPTFMIWININGTNNTSANNQTANWVVSFCAPAINASGLYSTAGTGGILTSNTYVQNMNATTFTTSGLGNNAYYGMWWLDLVNVFAQGTYTGTGSAQAITLPSWTTTPSVIWIFSNAAINNTSNPFLVWSLGASSSVTATTGFSSSATNLTDTQVTTYSGSGNNGFQVTSNADINTNAVIYFYAAWK